MAKSLAVLGVLLGLTSLTFSKNKPQQFPDATQLTKMTAQFAPTPIAVDTSKLSPGDKKALVKLIEAARIYNDIFMQQFWQGDKVVYEQLQKDKTPLGKARLRYFWINKGPWDSLDDYKAFMPGVPERKPLGAAFYPEDMTKAEFEAWVKTLDPRQKEQAEGFFTVIRRVPQVRAANLGNFQIVPFSQAYKADLEKCAALLKQAAAHTDNASLKKFLNSRAEAFLSNNYRPSDMDWMDLDAPLDVTIGPYETYNDELFGYKAAFEAYINLRDDAETAKLSTFSKHLQELENNLPEAPEYRNPKLGASSPIRVVNEIIASGDGAHGIQTAAYNLPNDDEVVQQKGAKRVMLRNIQQAKFNTVLLPIASRTLSAKAQGDVSFDMFFTHILAHELMHGLGPHQIKVNSRQTNPRLELKEIYSAIEEAKADATGLWALQYMMDHEKEMGIDPSLLKADEMAQRQLYTTFLASSFRTLRFGISEAHGKGMALQFNYLMDKGAFVPQTDGTFAVDYAKVKDAVRDLVHDLLTVEAQGDYKRAKQMLDRLGVIRPEVQKSLDKLQGIAIDIEPQYVTADELAPGR
jgi:Peptidase family M49